LLDVLVFVANILVMRFLTRLYIDLFSEVSAENPLAKLALGLTFLAMWILPAAGAVLKRWHFHQRLSAQGKTAESAETGLGGCLFNPLFYFCLNLVITSAVLTGLGDFLFGRRLLDTAAVFIPLVFAGLILTIVQPSSSTVTSRRRKLRRDYNFCAVHKAKRWATSACFST
jgi:hypothetical protein